MALTGAVVTAVGLFTAPADLGHAIAEYSAVFEMPMLTELPVPTLRLTRSSTPSSRKIPSPNPPDPWQTAPVSQRRPRQRRPDLLRRAQPAAGHEHQLAACSAVMRSSTRRQVRPA